MFPSGLSPSFLTLTPFDTRTMTAESLVNPDPLGEVTQIANLTWDYLLKWDPSTSLRTMAPTEQAFASSAVPQKLENIPIDQHAGAGLSCTVPSDSLQPRGLWPTRLLCPWGFSRPEHQSRLPCPPLDLPNSKLNPGSCTAGRFFTS